jgi:hypothetical protein
LFDGKRQPFGFGTYPQTLGNALEEPMKVTLYGVEFEDPRFDPGGVQKFVDQPE